MTVDPLYGKVSDEMVRRDNGKMLRGDLLTERELI